MMMMKKRRRKNLKKLYRKIKNLGMRLIDYSYLISYFKFSYSLNIGVHYLMKVMIVIFIIIHSEQEVMNNKSGQQIMLNK